MSSFESEDVSNKDLYKVNTLMMISLHLEMGTENEAEVAKQIHWKKYEIPKTKRLEWH